MKRVYLYHASRTPIGKIGGKLSPVRVDDSTYNRISQAREALGDDGFIMALVSRIKPIELDDTLTRIFRDLNLEVDGVQYF